MSDSEIRRADELLPELVELVETARSVPISGACVVPREHTLDLLDDLREVLPPEMAQARRIMADRDRLISTAGAEATETRHQADAAAEARIAEADAAARERTAAAEEHGARVVADARVEAARLVDAGEAENARLISSAGVHQAATAAAELMRVEAADYSLATRAGAEDYAAAVRAEADEHAVRVRLEADQYAAGMRRSAEEYADHTLGEIVRILQSNAATAERGRVELAARSGPAGAAPSASTAGNELFDGEAPAKS